MNLTRLWAKNCRTWVSVDLQLAEGITAVCGENGAGKSTLVNIADYALFGGRDLARLLTRGSGETQGEVGCEFEHGGEYYKVTRRFGAKPSLDLQRHVFSGADAPSDAPGGWNTETRETMAATQAELEALLGLDRQSFRASAFLAQGDGAAFTEAQPRDRKEILSRVLGLDIWGKLQRRAQDDRVETEHAMSKLLGAIEQAEGQLELRPGAEAVLEEARQVANKARADRDDLERGLAGVIEELEEAQRQHAAAEGIRDQLRSAEEVSRVLGLRAAEAAEAAAAAEKANDELAEDPLFAQAEQLEAEAFAALTQAEQAVASFARQQSLAAAAVRAVQSAEHIRAEAVKEKARLQLPDMRSGLTTCPMCGQPISGESAAHVEEEIAARLTQLDERISEAEKHLLDAVENRDHEKAELEKLGAVPSGQQARDAAQEARRRLSRARDLRAAAAQLPARRAAAADAAAEAQQAVEKAEQLRQRLQGLGPLPDLDALQSRRTRANIALSESVRQAEDFDRRAAKEEARLEALDGLAQQVERDRGLWEKARKQADIYKRLEEACGRNGVPALILDALALPFLEAEASRVIAELGRAFRVELRSQRATKGGDIREALDIVISTPEGEADYADFSGGEQTRLNIALRVALSRLLANSRGADVRFLVIDEPTHLDEQGFARLAEVLRGLEEFDRILVVSHVPALRDAFDSSVTVIGGGDTGEPSRLS